MGILEIPWKASVKTEMWKELDTYLELYQFVEPTNFDSEFESFAQVSDSELLIWLRSTYIRLS